MRRARLAALALPAVLVLGGCGDDDASSAGSAPPTTAVVTTAAADTTSTPSSSAAPDPDDQALADSLVLTQVDVGAEWMASPSDSSPEEDNPLASCGEGSDAFEPDPVAEADSPDFSLGGTQLSSSSTVYADAAVIRAQLDVFTDPGTPGCLTTLFGDTIASQLPAGVTVEDFTFEAVPFDAVEGTGYAFRGTGTIKTEAEEQPFTLVIIGDSAGRAGASVLFQFLGAADDDLVSKVWSTVEQKLAAVDG